MEGRTRWRVWHGYKQQQKHQTESQQEREHQATRLVGHILEQVADALSVVCSTHSLGKDDAHVDDLGMVKQLGSEV